MELTKTDFEGGKVFMKSNDNHTEIQYHFQPEKSTHYHGWIMTKLPNETKWQLYGHVTLIDENYINFDIDIFYDYWVDMSVEFNIFKLVEA